MVGNDVAGKGRDATSKDVDDFLAARPAEVRATLEKLRRSIRAAAPGAEETIGYGVPMFKLEGRPLVSFGAAAKHCSFYVMSPAVIEAHASDLRDYKLTKGSILFPIGGSIPAALVKKLVKARIEEIKAPSARRS